MPLVAQNSAPSTLATVIGQVVDAFAAMGNATPILVGKRYLRDGVGQDPRVVFVPEPSGQVRPGYELGRAARVVHSCDVFIRGRESGDDLGRFDEAYALADLVIACLATAASGRIEWGEYAEDSPTEEDAYGADVALSFTYARDVAHNAARWALPAATEDTTPAGPLVPPGEAGEVEGVTVTTTPLEAA